MDDLPHNTTGEPGPFTALAANTYEYHGWRTWPGFALVERGTRLPHGHGGLAPRKDGAMRRFLVFVALIGMLLSGLALAAQQGFSLSGRVGATDQEAQEGYFAIDNQTMIVVKPGSDLHNYLRARVGQRVRVTIEPQAGSE